MGEIEDSAASSAAGAPLLSSMTGKASPAKAAVGDRPVFDYIASLPEPQRSVALAIDDLAARTLPGLKRSVKWGMAYYGVGDGWCFSSGAFVGHVKLMFINGATLLDPVPGRHPDRDGQGDPRRRTRNAAGSRRTASRTLDETDHRSTTSRRKATLAISPLIPPPQIAGK